ncbi:MAG: Protein-methionine-sulfoxide reductase catalytic subunit MsrP [Chlamydiales bacterium]|nr:Protein-methionine-sulfoxide reductase catalytic subunit MsrP [Chlamydiales bacterium]
MHFIFVTAISLLLCSLASGEAADSSSLDVIKYDPYNAETPPKALIPKITPTESAYVRTNFAVPKLTEDHVIKVGGAVQNSLIVSVEDLKKMPQRTITATMECAGNDRLDMRPLPVGEPWGKGAVSTMTWTGVPLADILAKAGISSDAVEVLVTAADKGPREDAEGEVRFARSMPIEEAMKGDTLLALLMNGEPLTPDHGFPVRLAVPNWYGMASVKWIVRIDVLTEPFEGYFQKKRYAYDEANGVRPVDHILVKSIITEPADGAQTGRTIKVSGWAWSGNGAIKRVEVAVDGGDTWQEAKLGVNDSPHAWTPWSLTLSLPYRGRFVLRSRATDASGALQPDQIVWNSLGYGNNAVRQIVIDAD